MKRLGNLLLLFLAHLNLHTIVYANSCMSSFLLFYLVLNMTQVCLIFVYPRIVTFVSGWQLYCYEWSLAQFIYFGLGARNDE